MPRKIKHPDFLAGGGEMGERIRNFDWKNTPLGPPEQWDQSLKTCVRIMLTSSQPIWIGWGKELIKLYNDPYRAIAGGKHPDALGQPASVVWKDIWPDIAPMLKKVMEENEGTYVESALLIMERYGYPEETYYTFSYSPVPGTDGKTAGMICYNTPETEGIINERSLRTLRELGTLTKKKNLEEVYEAAVKVLGLNNKDFPFAIINKVDDEGSVASLFTVTGIPKDHPELPPSIDLKQPPEKGRHLAKAVGDNNLFYFEDPESWKDLSGGAWPIPPKSFVHIPIKAGNKKHPIAVLTIALNPYRKFDETYQNFVQLVADQISLEVNNVLAYEEERKRAEALAEIDKAKTVFFSNISHEFRTPLTLMLSPLEELMNQSQSNLSNAEKQNIETTHRNALRLLKLVNSLLDFSRIEAGRQEANFSLVDIVALTKNLASNFRSVVEKAGLQLIVKADTFIQPVYVDKQMWEKIVFNLLSNAFKYTLQGSITVELSAIENMAVLQVKDTGVGIPETELPHMFERFHRVQNTEGRSYEGTGIGLSLIKELVHMHHGNISVESKQGKGSTFIVKIPFGKEHLSGQQLGNAEKAGMDYRGDEITSNIYIEEINSLLDKDSEEHSDVNDTVPGTDRPLVMIVDDNADMREHIRSLLERKFTIITAANGLDALQKLRENKPALILSDIMMPIMDGIGLLKEIKNNKATAQIPFILLTARAGEESKIEGWQTGADDYLVKPFSSKELISRISSQIHTNKIRLSAQENLNNVIRQAPVAMTLLKGEKLIVEIANEKILELWSKKYDEVIQRPLFDILPELTDQGFPEILNEVYRSGKGFMAYERPVILNRNGKSEELYFSFSYEPLRNPKGEVEGIVVAGIDVTTETIANKKIAASEKKLKNVLSQSPNIFAILKGADMTIDFVNQPLLDSWGKDWSVVGKPLLEVLPELKEQAFPKLLEHVYNTGELYIGKEEKAVLIKEGVPQDVYFNYVYQPVFEANGNISGITIMAIDITKQTMARKQIEDSEKRYQMMLMQSPFAFAIFMGKDMVIAMANDSMKEVLGKGNDIEGKPLMDVLPELKGQVFPTLLDNVYTTGIPFHANASLARLYRNGKIEDVYFNFVYQPYREVDGTISGITVIAYDVTNEVIAGKKIEESAKQLSRLANAMPQLVWIADENGKTTYYNDRLSEFAGAEKLPEGSWKWDGLIHPADMPASENAWNIALTDGAVYETEHRIKMKEGSYRWFLSRAYPQRNDEGRITKWFGTATDIDAQKSHETRKDDFIKMASHELKTPVTTIKGYLQILQEKFKDTDEAVLQHSLVTLDRQINKLTKLISDLLDVTKIESGSLVLDKTVVDLNDLIQETTGDMQTLSKKHNVSFTSAGKVDVFADRERISQVLINLLTNAIKYSPDNVEIKILLKKDNGKAIVAVQDFGIGIEAGEQKKIFENFYRVKGKDEQTFPGFGIGLFVVSEILKQHNGEVWVESERNKGSIFYFSLPLHTS